jgi:hypothetical protein
MPAAPAAFTPRAPVVPVPPAAPAIKMPAPPAAAPRKGSPPVLLYVGLGAGFLIALFLVIFLALRT